MAGLYSPTASLTMRQLGYSVLPRVGANGGWANMAQVAQGMFRRWYGKGSVSQGELNAGLAPGGKVMQNLQTAVGDQTAQAMGPQLQMYNKLFQQGVSATNAQTMINDAAGNKNYDGTSAQKLLSNKYGIATSDLQKLKDTTAKQTGNTAGEMGGFDSALSQATTTVQKFDTVLGAILKMTGLGGVLGAAHGFSGAMGAVGGAVGGIFSKTVGMLSRFGGAAGNSLGPGGLSSEPYDRWGHERRVARVNDRQHVQGRLSGHQGRGEPARQALRLGRRQSLGRLRLLRAGRVGLRPGGHQAAAHQPGAVGGAVQPQRAARQGPGRRHRVLGWLRRHRDIARPRGDDDL